MTTVDGIPFIRVVHEPTQMSLLFLDVDAVSRKSKHLKQIIARQLFDAGSERKDGYKRTQARGCLAKRRPDDRKKIPREAAHLSWNGGASIGEQRIRPQYSTI